MFVLAVKLKHGVTAHHLQSFIDKMVPDLLKSRRIGSLTSLQMYSSAHTGLRLDEFVLMIDGFMIEPPLEGLDKLTDVVYSFECELTQSWPKDTDSGKH